MKTCASAMAHATTVAVITLGPSAVTPNVSTINPKRKYVAAAKIHAMILRHLLSRLVRQRTASSRAS
eukprot:4533283-Prymnesium_polylepis.1